MRPITHELRHFEEEFRYARAYDLQDRVLLEQKWAFNDAWEPVEYAPATLDKAIWLRIIPDVVALLDDHEVLVVDLKTGKKWGNEIKHPDQLTLYALAVASLYPQVTRIVSEVWYLDIDALTQLTFSVKQARRYLRGFNERGQEFTAPRRVWPAKAKKFNCRFCPYKTGEIWRGVLGTGDCDRNPK